MTGVEQVVGLFKSGVQKISPLMLTAVHWMGRQVTWLKDISVGAFSGLIAVFNSVMKVVKPFFNIGLQYLSYPFQRLPKLGLNKAD